MAKKPILADVTNMNTASTVINNNNDLIETAFDNTFSRDGSTPNQMEADIDLNGNGLLNIGNISLNNIPTSPTGLASGYLWNDGGILKIV